MSHLVETMFYVGQEPWHGLGTKLNQPPTSYEAIRAAGLDWDVETRPMFDHNFVSELMSLPDGTIAERGRYYDGFEEIPGIKVIRRVTDGRVLGFTGPRWTPVQNRDAFAFFDPMVQAGEAIYHTAGSLANGEIVWILTQIGEEQTIIGEDRMSNFLLLNMGHNGMRGINFMPTHIRVVCANTNRMAEEAGKNVTARFVHSPKVGQRMDEFRDLIRLFISDFTATTEAFRLMAKENLNGSDVDVYLKALFPDPRPVGDKAPRTMFAERLRENILRKFEGDLLGYELIPAENRATLWTLYNAVTEFVDHERGADETRLQHAWMGNGAKIKAKALALATARVR